MTRLGILNSELLAADEPVVTSIVPVLVPGMTWNLAASQACHARFFLPFTLGATGGFRFIMGLPGAATTFLANYLVIDTVTANTLFDDVQAANVAFTNASAVAGQYLLQADMTIINGATAGAVELLFAQNNSTANPITMLAGGYGEVRLY